MRRKWFVINRALTRVGSVMRATLLPELRESSVRKAFRSTVCASILVLGVQSTGKALIEGMQEFENRFEGIHVHPNALDDLKLLAIHRDLRTFPVNSRLTVRLYLPPETELELGNISVEASELEDFEHYFMRSKDHLRWKPGAWNFFQPWPTQDVLDVLHIRATNLGVLGSYSRPGVVTLYMPVDVYDSNSTSPVEGPPVYKFYLFIGVDLQSMSLMTSAETGTHVKLKAQQLRFHCDTRSDPNCTEYAAGTTHKFELDMSDLKAGRYRVTFTGTMPFTTNKVTLNVLIYHHP